MRILGIIPARYASTRFPAKALADIGGKSMIQRVYEQASKAIKLDEVIVATDHLDIAAAVKAFNGKYCMTQEEHQSGTDRCYEVLQKVERPDYVINIQGDEPFIDPDQIDLVASLLDGPTELATLVKRIEDIDEVFDSNVVKCVLGNNDQALYFSRSPIPFNRNNENKNWLNDQKYYKHIGIYGYRSDVLAEVTQLPFSSLEKTESLEQLRWLENGYKIKVAETSLPSIGIDTPEDLEKAKAFL